VLNELVDGDRSLDKFRTEYEKLHRALLKSHDSEKRLMQKCRELNSELVSNSAKVQSAMKLSEEDKSAITSLRKEIEKAWKMVDAAHEKEQRAKETIQSLRIEINNLTKLVEQGAGMRGKGILFEMINFSCIGITMGQEQEANDLLKIRDELTQERDKLLNDIAQLRRDVDEGSLKQSDLERQIQESNEQIVGLQEKIMQIKTENIRESKKRVCFVLFISIQLIIFN
jgi:chromosome segregation ATPase